MRTTRTTSRTPARAAAAVLAAGALTGLTALPATAHDELTGVAPEPGTVLETAPEELELSFSGQIMDIGHQVAVTDSEGRSVTAGEPRPEGTRLVQPLSDAGTEDETYDVVWRVVSSDGHPIEGSFSYEVGDGAGSGTAAPEDRGAGEDAAPAEDAPAAEARDAAGGTTGSDVPLWLVAVGGAAVALAVLGGVGLLSRRRGR
ncbi:copper resistance protein CopC [Kocuria flava]|uniref:copper resistance CopC family protein n=1 Tax=Kocuria flava TaxID=446860 RepID=UPI001FF5FCCD|nr:copper resistance CopC family protein [Kocuria flava]MCJ8506159.1 copper resistance protein CopC [Kocuria flava]